MDGSRTQTLMRFIRKLAGVSGRDVTDGDLVERFVADQDEAAFEALTDRHGPMVWGVCRRVLGNCADADDAYQATFLVLAKNAASIRKLTSVGPWLHGVALRIAQKARVSAARRRRRETEAAEARIQQAEDSLTLGEVKEILDEELNALPEKYKAPLVLCCLEGKSRDEAAAELGWSVGSLKGRLERARELLGQRLARRGLTLSAGLIALTLLDGAAVGAAPASLSAITVSACVKFAAGQAVAGTVSAQTLALTQSFLNGLIVAKLKPLAVGMFVLLGVGLASYPFVPSAIEVASFEKVQSPPVVVQKSAHPTPPPPAIELAAGSDHEKTAPIASAPPKEPEAPPKAQPKRPPNRITISSVPASNPSRIGASPKGESRPIAPVGEAKKKQ